MTNNILIVDDEPDNVELLEEYLLASDYQTHTAYSGEEALQVLNDIGPEIDAIFLDRMMPGMDGLEVLSKIKKDKSLADIPVIFQTAKADPGSTLEGLKAGAYYYLAKPFDRDQALAIVGNATSFRQKLYRSEDHAKSLVKTIKLLQSGIFQFHTITDAIRLSKLLGQLCPEPDTASIGLSELLINAVEHGNLGLTYKDKSEAMDSLNWEERIEERMQMPVYGDRRAHVHFDIQPDNIRFHVRDEGEGFDFSEFNEFSPERLLDSHGRGIMIARATCFTSLEYHGNGNEVVACIQVD